MKKEIKYCRVCGTYYSDSIYSQDKVCSIQCKTKATYSPQSFPEAIKNKTKRYKPQSGKIIRNMKRDKMFALQRENSKLKYQLNLNKSFRRNLNFYESDEWKQ